ncbi:helix-turn-helix transcriptional regulator [Clostridium sp. YIM B02505]|uniref:Helix-turn-helix transcriptional regulator n=1 Tax=Clostridium yunnanense TaxID=2800325 RepID=A0ABS1EQE9_9CLOT|nr:helix-turn-helix transcriptional regulator [Clostridium yunnanense]MBK1811565.1 helix-turn-helix transcriptional regulator [Clostridium yunnanense]
MYSFGQILRELRNAKDVTLDTMAEDLNTTKATLSRYENDLREPKIDFVIKVAEYFNVSTDYLLGKTNTPIYEKVEPKEEEIVIVDPKLKELFENTKDLPNEAITNLNEIAKNLKNSYEIIEYKKNNDKIEFILNKDVKPDGLTKEELEEAYRLAKELDKIRNKK